ncbi:binding-protein-dependent transport system inner membrane protein [Klebsiella aerogenes]|nr:binding-protein-dependent transport system inner membrane protein [Klebsiella aerogenes]
MMLSKKNSEALEHFSEKLEVEGRSLWQDARRRFMHNRAAVASLIVLVIIALFVTIAPMLSQFSYFDTDWGMMSNARIWSLVTILVPIHPAATCWCAWRLAGAYR